MRATPNEKKIQSMILTDCLGEVEEFLVKIDQYEVKVLHFPDAVYAIRKHLQGNAWETIKELEDEVMRCGQGVFCADHELDNVLFPESHPSLYLTWHKYVYSFESTGAWVMSLTTSDPMEAHKIISAISTEWLLRKKGRNYIRRRSKAELT